MLGTKPLLWKPQFYHGYANDSGICPLSQGLLWGRGGGKPNCKVLGVFVPIVAMLGCDPVTGHACVKSQRVEGVQIDGLQK